jgi:DNA primase
MAPRRYIYNKTFYIDKDRDKPVYCLDYIVKNNISTAILCEGPIDVLTCYSRNYPAIGTWGNPSPSQIEAINKSPIKVLYLGMDNDWAGQRMANVVRAGLDPRIIIKEIKWPQKDPNACSLEEFQKAINDAKNS